MVSCLKKPSLRFAFGHQHSHLQIERPSSPAYSLPAISRKVAQESDMCDKDIVIQLVSFVRTFRCWTHCDITKKPRRRYRSTASHLILDV